MKKTNLLVSLLGLTFILAACDSSTTDAGSVSSNDLTTGNTDSIDIGNYLTAWDSETKLIMNQVIGMELDVVLPFVADTFYVEIDTSQSVDIIYMEDIDEDNRFESMCEILENANYIFDEEYSDVENNMASYYKVINSGELIVDIGFVEATDEYDAGHVANVYLLSDDSGETSDHEYADDETDVLTEWDAVTLGYFSDVLNGETIPVIPFVRETFYSFTGFDEIYNYEYVYLEDAAINNRFDDIVAMLVASGFVVDTENSYLDESYAYLTKDLASYSIEIEFFFYEEDAEYPSGHVAYISLY